MITCDKRTAVALLVLMALATPSDAQQDGPIYAGGTLTALTQTHSDAQPLGGTTWNGSAFVGGWFSPRLAIEFESSFGRTFSWEYSYRQGSFTADVVASRRDTFWAPRSGRGSVWSSPYSAWPTCRRIFSVTRRSQEVLISMIRGWRTTSQACSAWTHP